ncbi:MAG: peptidylprolyl isomerase [Planctomycetota bacterium]|jgi:peptidyl-prolyl cis-trans isomerase B (cyclophilin B)
MERIRRFEQLAVLVMIAAALTLASCAGKEGGGEAPKPEKTPAAKDDSPEKKPPVQKKETPEKTPPAPEEASPEDVVAVLHTTQGTIKIEFFPDKAPEHVKNFISLAKQGLFDGTYFHRVFPGFMIQGGDFNTKDDDPGNDGGGGHSYKGPGTFLKAEFNDVHHARGVVSMARTDDPNSAGSQFFIMVAPNRGLDGKYSAFGRVIDGMDAVDKIVKQPGKPISGRGDVNPFEHQTIDKVTFEKKK